MRQDWTKYEEDQKDGQKHGPSSAAGPLRPPLHILPPSSGRERRRGRFTAALFQAPARSNPHTTGDRPGAEGQNPPFGSVLPPVSSKELQEPPASTCDSRSGVATTRLSLTLSLCVLLPILLSPREQPPAISSCQGLENRRGQGGASSTSLCSYWGREVGRPPPPAGTLSPERSRGGWGSTGEWRGVVPSLQNPDAKELCPG